jgi:hypothetical protein
MFVININTIFFYKNKSFLYYNISFIYEALKPELCILYKGNLLRSVVTFRYATNILPLCDVFEIIQYEIQDFKITTQISHHSLGDFHIYVIFIL